MYSLKVGSLEISLIRALCLLATVEYFVLSAAQCVYDMQVFITYRSITVWCSCRLSVCGGGHAVPTGRALNTASEEVKRLFTRTQSYLVANTISPTFFFKSISLIMLVKTKMNFVRYFFPISLCQ